MPKVLLVLTSVDKYPDGSPTGWYLPEAAHPYMKFKQAGFDIEWASITGTATCDPSSIDASKDDKECMDFIKEAIAGASQTKLDDVDTGAYDAVLFVGGFGTMWDFPESAACEKVIKAMYAAGKVVAAVCHGPIVFKNIEVDGVHILKGKEVTGFTNAEENAMGKYAVVSEPSGPGSCEDVLAAKGALFKDGGVFEANVCIAGNIYTGQNPPSAGPLAEAVVAALCK
jgi:putative intracellular protease/amidase